MEPAYSPDSRLDPIFSHASNFRTSHFFDLKVRQSLSKFSKRFPRRFLYFRLCQFFDAVGFVTAKP